METQTERKSLEQRVVEEYQTVKTLGEISTTLYNEGYRTNKGTLVCTAAVSKIARDYGLPGRYNTSKKGKKKAKKASAVYATTTTALSGPANLDNSLSLLKEIMNSSLDTKTKIILANFASKGAINGI